MITNFKLFESINRSKKPNIDDYVICNNTSFTQPEIISYIKTHIGKIVEIRNRNGRLMLPTRIIIEYDYNNTKIQSRLLDINDIKYWSKNHDELLPLLKIAKYNL